LRARTDGFDRVPDAAITAFAPAKVNLTLHVTGQRADGYHLLDSLVVFADVGDRLWLTPESEMALDITGPFADGVPGDARNLAWRAAEWAGWTGRIRLEKNLPHGAGLGGGSADAAAVLRALGAEADARLGADVPACHVARASIMSGIGDRVQPLPRPLPPLFAVLVNPRVTVSTPEVFAALVEKDNAPMDVALPVWRSAAEFIDWLEGQRNDLETPAMRIAPEICQVLEALRRHPECQLARMSGSGATCFALCAGPEEAGAVAAAISERHPDWWCVATMLS
jgi:4-diphosphocytidyl-2-C-methyl-D-erythritol kinase